MTDYIVTRADESELEHHGVKGQKWGVKRYVKENAYNRASMYTHPIISAKSNYKNLIKHPVSAQYGGKAYLKDANSEIRSKIAAKKAAKVKNVMSKKMSEVKGEKWDIKRYVKENAYNRASMYTHPIISAKSNYKNLIKHPVSAQYGGKSYLKDANSEIRSKIAAKKSQI